MSAPGDPGPLGPELTPLCALARKYESDKGGWHLRYGGGDSDTCHNYTPVYNALYTKFRTQVASVLEIGINSGASLRMWRDFFPNAQVVGLDIRRECLFSEERIRSFYADQNNPESLQQALVAIGNGTTPSFDLVVDDGSHEYEHIVTSMKHLLPYVADRGLYIIEDVALDCQPQIVGAHVPEGYNYYAIPTGHGIGKAHCDPNCPHCHGTEGERLIVIKRNTWNG